MVEGEEVGALVRESWVIAQGSSRVCRARGRGRLLQVAARLMINEGNEEESDCPEETRSERWGRCGGKGCDKRVEESLVVLVALVTSGGPPRRRCTLGDHPRAKRQWAARREVKACAAWPADPRFTNNFISFRLQPLPSRAVSLPLESLSFRLLFLTL